MQGKVYRCTVGSEGFTPVELLGQDFSTTDQTEVHDRFRLAVLIHYLLFGCHPFSGEWTGVGDPPEQTELIRRGFWAYGQNSLIGPSRNTILLDVVHPEIKRCFLQCFNNGHTAPHLRPSAEDWHNALIVAIQDLAACNTLDSHHYSRSYGKCYWCERKATLGVDIFPGNPGTASVPTVLGIPSVVSQPSAHISTTPITTTYSSQTVIQPALQPYNNFSFQTLSKYQPLYQKLKLLLLVVNAVAISTFAMTLIYGHVKPASNVEVETVHNQTQQDLQDSVTPTSTDATNNSSLFQSNTNTSSTKEFEPVMIGTWHGNFGLNNPSSTLIINRQSQNLFWGTLTTKGKRGGTFVIAIEGTIDSMTKEVTMYEVNIIQKPSSETWFLGSNIGLLSSNYQEISGQGKDFKNNNYLWKFYKQ